MNEGLRELKGAQNHENSVVCEISQPKIAPCENGLRCEITILLRNNLQASKWLRNHLQATKWPSGYEIDLRNGGGFVKTPCKAKGCCENANKAPHHASEKESPMHPEITHTKPLTPFLTSLKPSEPIAPVKSSS